MGLLAAVPRKEAHRGESAQDGDRAVDTFVTCARLVRPTDRHVAWRPSRDGLAVRSCSVGGPVKTGHCADFTRPGPRGFRTGQGADRR